MVKHLASTFPFISNNVTAQTPSGNVLLNCYLLSPLIQYTINCIFNQRYLTHFKITYHIEGRLNTGTHRRLCACGAPDDSIGDFYGTNNRQNERQI